MKNKCRRGCSGLLKPDKITQTYERKGSSVRVTIKNIPVSTCPVCGDTLMSLDIAREIDNILLPFHGSGKTVPKLPPAEVLVDFNEVLVEKTIA